MRFLNADIWHRNTGIGVENIRLPRMKYILSYSFQLLLFTVLGQFLDTNYSVGPVSAWTIASVLYMIGSLVAILPWNKHFKPQVLFWVISAGVFIIPAVLIPDSLSKFIFTSLFYLFYGGIMTCTRCGFAYGTNNSEKAISLIAFYFVDRIVRIVYSLGYSNVFWKVVLPIVVFAVMAVSLLMYKEDELEVIEESGDKDIKGFWWGLVYFLMFFWVGNNIIVFPKDYPNYLFFGALGSFIGIIILIGMLFVFRVNTFHIWNVFLLATIVRYAACAFFDGNATYNVIFFSGGVMQFGWPLSLYMLGCVQRRFADYKLLKKSTIIYLIASPLIQYERNIFELLCPEKTDLLMFFSILAAVIIILMMSPYSNKYLFASEWLEQLTDSDMKLVFEEIEEKDRFEKWKLSPRQKEVAMLLLMGKTRRQISGELKLSESTVKLHTSELYKKLGINSRMELFSLFGVEGKTTEE